MVLKIYSLEVIKASKVPVYVSLHFVYNIKFSRYCSHTLAKYCQSVIGLASSTVKETPDITTDITTITTETGASLPVIACIICILS